MKPFVKFFFSLVIILSSLELIARNLNLFLPIEVQQKYTKVQVGNGFAQRNGRGARGEWPRSNQIQIAIFGSSILGNPGSKDEILWTTLMEKESEGRIHIDNFGLGGNNQTSTTAIMRSLKKMGLRYDVVIVNVTPTFRINPNYNPFAMSYQSRWILDPSEACMICELARKFWQRRSKIENQFLPASLRITSLSEPMFEPKAKKPNAAISGYNKGNYQQMRSENRFTDATHVEKEKNLIKERLKIQTMFEAAKDLADHVLWMPESTIYHPKMKPSYLDHFAFLVPIDSNDRNTTYLSPKAYAERFRQSIEVTRQMLPKFQIDEINWHEQMNEVLTEKEHLFSDEFHLTEKGNQIVFEILWPKLRSYLLTHFKIESR